MKRFAELFEQLTPIKRIFLTAVPAAAIFYFAAFLSTWIGQLWTGADWKWRVTIHGLSFVFLASVAIALIRIFEATRDELNRERNLQAERVKMQKQLERDALAFAHTRCDRVISSMIGPIDDHYGSPLVFVEKFSTSLKCIQDYVTACYLTFEAMYGNGSDPMERINFEVTFMTISYTDGEITIPACANRENRAPRSMVLREKDKKKYEQTETAKMYRADRPEPIIVQDTHQEQDYDSLYAGQLNRLRSSIIYPVLSEKNVLLGTLVVHCDAPSFFTCQQRLFWFELLEIFAKRIGFEKKKLDVLTNIQTREIRLQLPIPKSF